MLREPSFRLAIRLAAIWLTLMVPSFAALPQLHNVALNKTAQQSSALYSVFLGSNAIDGDISDDNFFHSTIENHPYWTVDLGNIYGIDRINVYSHSTYRTKADVNVNFHTALSVDGVNYADVCYIDGKIPNPYTCNPVGTNRARWVKLTQDEYGYLLFNEVEVMAKKDIPSTNTEFKYVTSVKGTGSVLQTRPVLSDVQCTYYCSRNTNCISVNVVTKPTGMECKLLESDVTTGTSDANIAYWKVKD